MFFLPGILRFFVYTERKWTTMKSINFRSCCCCFENLWDRYWLILESIVVNVVLFFLGPLLLWSFWSFVFALFHLANPVETHPRPVKKKSRDRPHWSISLVMVTYHNLHRWLSLEVNSIAWSILIRAVYVSSKETLYCKQTTVRTKPNTKKWGDLLPMRILPWSKVTTSDLTSDLLYGHITMNGTMFSLHHCLFRSRANLTSIHYYSPIYIPCWWWQ